MPARHRSRYRAVQILYECDLRALPAGEAIRHFYDGLYSEEHDQPPAPDPFMESLVHGTLAGRAAIDERLSRLSAHWRLERMSVVDRNILRLAVFEMQQGETPPAVVIDEAVELARRLSGEESAAFINGVLDAARKELANSAS
jgi:N utilization substance protein B